MSAVIVDTTVWSLALRRKPGARNPHEEKQLRAWTRLVKEGGALLIGPVRQEILCGIRDEHEFEKLRQYLGFFEDIPLLRNDHEQAARFFNTLKTKGVAATSIDLMLCAAAFRLNLEIFTTDLDFDHYARCLPVRLYVLKN